MSFGTTERASTSGSAASATSGSFSGPNVRAAAVARSAAAHTAFMPLFQAAQRPDDLVLRAGPYLRSSGRLGLRGAALGRRPVEELAGQLDLERGQLRACIGCLAAPGKGSLRVDPGAGTHPDRLLFPVPEPLRR